MASLAAFLLVAVPLMYLGRMAGDSFSALLLEQKAVFARVHDGFAQSQGERARRDLLTVHEAESVNLTRLFANALWEKDFAPFVAKAQSISDAHCRTIADVIDAGGKTVQPEQKKACYAEIGRSIMAFPEFRAIDAKAHDTMKDSTVFKIKVYDLRGITVYSSEHGQIGEDQIGNVGWHRALAGEPVSALFDRDAFNAFDGAYENRDLIEIYLPVTAPDSKKVVGVLEIYSDVTPFLEQIDSTSKQIQKIAAENQAQLERAVATNVLKGGRSANVILATVLVLLALLYYALFMIVRNGQRTIDKQNIEREQSELALRESEARFRSLSELSSDWYWEQDGDFRYVDASSRVRDRLNNDAYLGKTPWELPFVGVSEEQWARHRADIEAHRPFRKFEYALRTRYGGLMHVSASGEPIFDERGIFKGYRGIGRDITESKLAEERIQSVAHHDALTGLPNRLLFKDRLTQAMATGKRSGCFSALMFLDLDNFKPLNDTHGHAAGDLLLIEAAKRLKSCVRETDTVARFGGDEFVVMIVELSVDQADSRKQAGVIAEKIRAVLARPYALKIQRNGELPATVGHRCTVSVGVALFGRDDLSQNEILKWADTAMYQAKAAGRNLIRFYDSNA
ncbi:MAG: GGDEF domain-containing protein [Burkholderiales bacterium]|nr:GGDEF domain-containing protein [Burkholderiales bacterium]